MTTLEGSKLQRSKRMSVLRCKLVSCLFLGLVFLLKEQDLSQKSCFLCCVPDITNLQKRSPADVVVSQFTTKTSWSPAYDV